jgi:hypothetical protein
MTHRTVIRFFSGALLMALVLGCGDDEPTAPSGPFLTVAPLFRGMIEGTTQQLTATINGEPVAVTWASSNTAVITVTPAGLVTAVGAGRAAATATLVSDPTQLRSASLEVTSPPLLTSGTNVAVPAGTGARGTQRLYKIVVPTGATSLSISLSGGTGDVDLFIQEGSPPSNTVYDCSSENGGNSENCTIANPTPGTWFVMLYLWDPYAGVTLTPVVTP